MHHRKINNHLLIHYRLEGKNIEINTNYIKDILLYFVISAKTEMSIFNLSLLQVFLRQLSVHTVLLFAV